MKTKFKTFSFTLWFCVLNFSLFAFPVFAQAPDIGYSRISPASPIYFLKAAKESLEIKLSKTPLEKLALHLDFSYRRLREARTLISQREDLVPATLERYLSEVNSLPREHQENSELGLKIKEALALQIKALDEMYSQTLTEESKRALRYVMNRLIQRPDVEVPAKIPICSLFAKEASSSALNATERWMLTKRTEKCFAPAGNF